MKFFAYAALVASTSAISLRSMPFQQQQVQVTMPLDEMFKAIDTNGDGALTMDEIMTALDKYCHAENGCHAPSRAEVQQVFDHVDTNKDGKATVAEIETAIFEAVDTNDDGAWSLKEVTEAVAAMAKELDLDLVKDWKKRVAWAFKLVDANKDGLASPKEIKAAIKKHGYPNFEDLVKK